jgi:hypothetical protein
MLGLSRTLYFFFSPSSGDAHADRPNIADGGAVGSGVYFTSSERRTSSMR